MKLQVWFELNSEQSEVHWLILGKEEYLRMGWPNHETNNLYVEGNYSYRWWCPLQSIVLLVLIYISAELFGSSFNQVSFSEKEDMSWVSPSLDQIDLKVDKARCPVKNIITSLILIDWARMVDHMLLRPRWWGVWLDRRADVAVWQLRKHEAGRPHILVLCLRPGPCWSTGRSDVQFKS